MEFKIHSGLSSIVHFVSCLDTTQICRVLNYIPKSFFVLKPVKLSQNYFLKPSAKNVTRKLGENIEKLIKNISKCHTVRKRFLFTILCSKNNLKKLIQKGDNFVVFTDLD